MNTKNNYLMVPTIVALALVLRLAGALHGFPYIFHPDEPTVIRTALSIRFFPNPGHFDWPHLYIYLNFIVYMVFAKIRDFLNIIGLKDTVLFSFVKIIWDDSVIYYLITRVFSATLGALTVVPIYMAGRDTFNRRVGLLAAIALAITPFHVWHSHYALIDVPMMFFATWGVYFTLRILNTNTSSDYAGAGFYTGLAASTKYNAALNTIGVPLAHVIRVIKNKEKFFDVRSLTNLVLAGFSCIIAFLLGTPYALLDYNTFLRTDGPKGALWQFHNVGSLTFNERLPEFFNEMLFKVSDDLGYSILLGFFLLFALVLYRLVLKRTTHHDAILSFILIMGIGLLLYVSGVENSRSHYFFVAYPYVILGFAYMMDFLLAKFENWHTSIGLMIFILALGIPAFMSIKNAYTFVRNDTRVYMYNWLKTNLATNEVVYFTDNDTLTVLARFPHKEVNTIQQIPSFGRGYYVSLNEPQITDKRFRLVARISKFMRLGPKITIFAYNK